VCVHMCVYVCIYLNVEEGIKSCEMPVLICRYFNYEQSFCQPFFWYMGCWFQSACFDGVCSCSGKYCACYMEHKLQ